MLISFKVLILRAAIDLQISLNSSSGHTEIESFYDFWLVVSRKAKRVRQTIVIDFRSTGVNHKMKIIGSVKEYLEPIIIPRNHVKTNTKNLKLETSFVPASHKE
jgi:hypothetical protein